MEELRGEVRPFEYEFADLQTQLDVAHSREILNRRRVVWVKSFKFMKSMQILYYPFLFIKNTLLKSHSGYFTSLMEPILSSFFISSFTTQFLSLDNHLYFFLLPV